ncbi:MAG: hypothetical protein HKN33_19085 [Pyrinomonadaceae bacterium]|nr:hypothetical protein [Pyrinomonadaceae bacterium]
MAETILLRWQKKLGEKGATGYVIVSNVLGVVVMCGFGAILMGTAVLFFGATLGGAFWISLLSIVFVLVLLVLTPLLMFAGRSMQAVCLELLRNNYLGSMGSGFRSSILFL